MKRNKLFTFLLLLCFVIGLTAISVPELHAAPLPYGISGLLENDPRHMSYSPDSDYGKPEFTTLGALTANCIPGISPVTFWSATMARSGFLSLTALSV